MEASTITSLGTCRLVMPLSELTMASAGPSAYVACDVGLDGGLLLGRAATRSPYRSPKPLLGRRPALKVVGVLGEHVLEEHADGMAEDDGVGDLHHGGLEVQGEEHALGLGAAICSA
jgi:hypothetical protein